MSKPLPTGNFQWVLGRELEKFSDPNYILQLDSHGPTCYFLEVKQEEKWWYWWWMVAGGPRLWSKASWLSQWVPSCSWNNVSDWRYAQSTSTWASKQIWYSSWWWWIKDYPQSSPQKELCIAFLVGSSGGGGGVNWYCCCCCRNLKQYLQMGLKLTKVHKVMKCNQSTFLEPYIEKNTEIRRQATNPVDVARAKAMVSISSSSSSSSFFFF